LLNDRVSFKIAGTTTVHQGEIKFKCGRSVIKKKKEQWQCSSNRGK